MELLAFCILAACGLGLLIYRGYHLYLYFAYPLPGKELKWKQSPKLPLQDVVKRGRPGSGRKAKKDKQGFTRSSAEIPLETVSVEQASLRTSSPEYGRTNPGTDV